MYDRLLWATDASPEADAALEEAVRLLGPGGTLIAFHSDERFVGGRVGGEPVFADETDRRAKLRRQVDELKAAGVDAELVIETTHHSPVSAIAHAAESHRVDAIVCGTRGLGVLTGAFVGSVALRLPHLATCPVIVVPARLRVPAH